MQAATTAAQKGHDVTLYEKSNKLGGQMILAAAPPDKQDLNNFLNYLNTQVAKSGVKVELNKEATPPRWRNSRRIRSLSQSVRRL